MANALTTNSTLIRKWFDEVWNQGREETIDAMCAKDAIGYGQAQHGTGIQGAEKAMGVSSVPVA